MPVSTEQDLFLYMTRGSRLFAIFMIAKQTLTLWLGVKIGSTKKTEQRPKQYLLPQNYRGSFPFARPADVVSPRACWLFMLLFLGRRARSTGTVFALFFFPRRCIGEGGNAPGGEQHITFQSVNDWILSVRDLRPRVSVHETVYKMHVEQFGSIASAFYSHNSETTEQRRTDIRRVNSCQMLNDGKRWWIASVVWNVSPKNWDLPHELDP
jgi:hypothetical protein